MTLTLASTAAACDAKEQCLGDCDSAGDATAGLDSDNQICEDAHEPATQWISDNNACDTVLDCVQLEAICFRGEHAGPCGTVAVSQSASATQWSAFEEEFEEVCDECLAAECGSDVMCTDAGQCEAVFGSEAFCPSIARDVQTFLAANRACETDADCMSVQSMCYVDDCYEVVVNVDTDVEAWQRLDQTLLSCATDGADSGPCNVVGDCGFEPVCNEQGQCAPSR